MSVCDILAKHLGEPFDSMKLSYINRLALEHDDITDVLNLSVTVMYYPDWVIDFRLESVSVKLPALSDVMPLSEVYVVELAADDLGAPGFEVVDEMSGYSCTAKTIRVQSIGKIGELPVWKSKK